MTAMDAYLAVRDDAFNKMTATLDDVSETYATLIEPLQAQSQATVATIREYYDTLIRHLSTERDSLIAAETRQLFDATTVATQAYEASRRLAHVAYDDAIAQAWNGVLAERARWQV